VFLALWALDYGWIEGARRYLRHAHDPDEPKPAEAVAEAPKAPKPRAARPRTKAPG
jgi:hypothetical protein